jgi:hypothetical protein
MQKEIIIALVASSAALITSLVSAYVSIRGQKIQETDNSISSGYQLKAGHFLSFYLYGNSTIKQNLRSY